MPARVLTLFAILLAVAVIVRAEDESEAPAQRVARIKVTNGPMDVAKRRTLADSRIVFLPGKRAELRIDDIKGDPKISRLDIAVNSALAGALQRHIVDLQLTSTTDKKNTVVSAPKLMVREGSPATVHIGDGAENLQVEVLIEPAK